MIGIIFQTLLMTFHGIADAAEHPVRIWGNLSTVYRERDFNAGNSHASDWQLVSAINASSYIWQPWFALINGSLSFSSNKGESTEQVAIRNQYIDGKFRLNLFPTSRFPFLFYASKSQNDLDAEVFGRTITGTIIGMRQQYTSRNGRQFYRGNIERNVRDDLDQESFVSDSITFVARRRMEDNIIYGDIDFDNIEKPNKDDVTNYSITGRHSFTGNRNLTLENIVSTSQTHNNFINSFSDTKNNQLSSFLSWRPDNRADLNITGNLRIAEFTQLFSRNDLGLTDSDIFRNEQATININQGLIYNYTPKITFTESINGSQIETKDGYQFIGSKSAGINYNADSLATSIGFYSWNSGANINHLHGDNIATEKSLKGRLGHSVTKNIFLTSNIKLQSSFNQSAGYDFKSGKDNASKLNHSVTINWSESSFTNSSSVRFLATDVRIKDINERQFQLFNLQISKDYRISRHIHLFANLTFQKSIVTNNQQTTESQHSNGQLNYINNRFLNISGLSFKTEFRFSKKESTSQKSIVRNNNNLVHDNAWKNGLVYRIGLFESRFNLDYVKNNGTYDRIIKIQISRNFGNL
jgi:hypothetical protein